MNRRAIASLMLLCSLAAFHLTAPGRAESISPHTDAEIRHLLDYIEQSGCHFYRNGTWYDDTKAARDHVVLKYRYFMKKGQIVKTEDFIRWCATRSEMSGKAYLVKPQNGPSLLLSEWLLDELRRYREKTQEISGEKFYRPPNNLDNRPFFG